MAQLKDRTAQITPLTHIPALSAASIRATRPNVWDLLVVKPHGELSLLLQGFQELPIQLRSSREPPKTDTDMDVSFDNEKHVLVVSAEDAHWGNVTLVYEDGKKSQVTFDIFPQDKLVLECFQLLALTLPAEITFEVRRLFLERWCERTWSTAQNFEFDCFSSVLLHVFGLEVEVLSSSTDPWSSLAKSTSHARFTEDPILRRLQRPLTIPVPRPIQTPSHPLLAPLLYGLHTLAELLRLSTSRQQDLLKFVPLICRIAVAVRPEWADYWKRLVPDATTFWPSSLTIRELQQTIQIDPWRHSYVSVKPLNVWTIEYLFGLQIFLPYCMDVSARQTGRYPGMTSNTSFRVFPSHLLSNMVSSIRFVSFMNSLCFTIPSQMGKLWNARGERRM